MVKTMEETILNLRRDVARWKAHIQDLQDIRDPTIAADIQKWVDEAERVIAQWENME